MCERQHSLRISSCRERDQDSSCTHTCPHFLPRQSDTAFLFGRFSGCPVCLGTETGSERPSGTGGAAWFCRANRRGGGGLSPAATVLHQRGRVFLGNKDGTFLSRCRETQTNTAPRTHCMHTHVCAHTACTLTCAHALLFLSTDSCARFPPWHALSHGRRTSAQRQ